MTVGLSFMFLSVKINNVGLLPSPKNLLQISHLVACVKRKGPIISNTGLHRLLLDLISSFCAWYKRVSAFVAQMFPEKRASSHLIKKGHQIEQFLGGMKG